MPLSCALFLSISIIPLVKFCFTYLYSVKITDLDYLLPRSHHLPLISCAFCMICIKTLVKFIQNYYVREFRGRGKLYKHSKGDHIRSPAVHWADRVSKSLEQGAACIHNAFRVRGLFVGYLLPERCYRTTTTQHTTLVEGAHI